MEALNKTLTHYHKLESWNCRTEILNRLPMMVRIIFIANLIYDLPLLMLQYSLLRTDILFFYY